VTPASFTFASSAFALDQLFKEVLVSVFFPTPHSLNPTFKLAPKLH
jgi:hypothetical protein